jgi:hypothetical protein
MKAQEIYIIYVKNILEWCLKQTKSEEGTEEALDRILEAARQSYDHFVDQCRIREDELFSLDPLNLGPEKLKKIKIHYKETTDVETFRAQSAALLFLDMIFSKLKEKGNISGGEIYVLAKTCLLFHDQNAINPNFLNKIDEPAVTFVHKNEIAKGLFSNTPSGIVKVVPCSNVDDQVAVIYKGYLLY